MSSFANAEHISLPIATSSPSSNHGDSDLDDMEYFLEDIVDFVSFVDFDDFDIGSARENEIASAVFHEKVVNHSSEPVATSISYSYYVGNNDISVSPCHFDGLQVPLCHGLYATLATAPLNDPSWVSSIAANSDYETDYDKMPIATAEAVLMYPANLSQSPPMMQIVAQEFSYNDDVDINIDESHSHKLYDKMVNQKEYDDIHHDFEKNLHFHIKTETFPVKTETFPVSCSSCVFSGTTDAASSFSQGKSLLPRYHDIDTKAIEIKTKSTTLDNGTVTTYESPFCKSSLSANVNIRACQAKRRKEVKDKWLLKRPHRNWLKLLPERANRRAASQKRERINGRYFKKNVVKLEGEAAKHSTISIDLSISEIDIPNDCQNP